MFFSIFLIGNYQAVLISPFSNNLTVIFGYIVFGLFHVSNITVLLNMLIAMMTRSYETILVRKNTQRKNIFLLKYFNVFNLRYFKQTK